MGIFFVKTISELVVRKFNKMYTFSVPKIHTAYLNWRIEPNNNFYDKTIIANATPNLGLLHFFIWNCPNDCTRHSMGEKLWW